MILSDVIEHLTDPRPLVAWMRAQLITRPGSRLVVSTPDRTLLDYEDVNGRPENKSHVREWSITELERYFVSSGLEVIRSGHTRANQYDPVISTIFIECTCSEEFYKTFLNNVGLLHGDDWPQHLLVTTEYAGIHNTGGIGTFVREQRESYGYDKSLCLFGGIADGLTQEILRTEKLVSTAMLLVDSEIHSLPLEDQLLKAVQQLLFYFPDLSTIQYGDYQGIGCRIAQAKQTGLLPQTIRIIVHCHGITHYLENAHEFWLGLSHAGTAEKEKISVEGADLVVFPTTFLRKLYAEAGINVPAENNFLLRYPLHSSASKLDPSTKIDTLIFYGKRSRMKGYDLLLDCLVDADVEQWKKAGITTICLIGPTVHGSQETDPMLEVLREHYQVEEFCNLSRQQAINVLHERAHRAICLMPYLGDNHPYALLDVALSTTVPLMVNAGGVPEMIPENFRNICLADPNALSLRVRMHDLLALSPDEFHDLRTSFVSTMAQAQKHINELVKAFPGDQQPKVLSGETGEATIIVPVFNTPLDYIEDLIFGLNNQSLKPAEVVFVDDTSEEDYVAGLQTLVKEHLLLPYRIIRHPQNKGLAGARNTGLAAVKSEFIINIDSDDVPLNDFVRDIVFALRSNPQHVAAVPYLCAFDDGTDFNIVRSGMYVYRPLGDGVIASQLDNQLGHANAGFRASTLREFGGWDESSKAMWEDWALYLKLTAAGRKIAIIPKIGCLYRVRPQSMLRTYKTWPAMRRLANNMLGLPRYENFRLQAMLRSYRDIAAHEAELRHRLGALQAEFSILQQEVNVSRLELNRGGARAVRNLANRLAKYPALFDVLSKCGRTGWKILRRLSQLARRLRG